MKLHILRETGELLTPSVRVKLGTRMRLDVSFMGSGSCGPETLADGAAGRLAAKRTFSDAELAIDAGAWTPGEGNGGTVYTFPLELRDNALAALIVGEPEVTFLAEIEWQEDGYIYKTPTFPLIVENRVIVE